jgi:CHAD domain-containing protein
MNKKSRKHAHLETTLTASDAIRTILTHNLDYLAMWEQAARSPEDIEGVHQTRVAFRRMRSALTIFRLAIPKQVSAPWSEEMRELAGQLGQARDLDVFIDEALGGMRDKLPLPGAAKLEALAIRNRDKAYENVRSMLDSEQFSRFKTEFGHWVDNKGWEQAELKKKQRELLEGSLVTFARKVLDRQERRVLEAGAHVDKHSAGEMHQLRIECKKLRYAAEFFLPVFAGMDDFIGHMKGLQDLLGVMNDVAVMRGLLDQILEGDVDLEALEYAGGVVGWRACYYHELLYSFERRWDEFVEAKHPWWKKSSMRTEAV